MKPLGRGGPDSGRKKYESKSMICIYTFLHHVNKRFSEKSFQGSYVTHFNVNFFLPQRNAAYLPDYN